MDTICSNILNGLYVDETVISTGFWYDVRKSTLSPIAIHKSVKGDAWDNVSVKR